MYVLLGLSVLATAIVLLKALQLLRLRLIDLGRVEEAILACARRDFEGARLRLDSCRHPVATALRSAIDVVEDTAMAPGAAQAEVERVGTNVVRALESWLRGLSAIAHLSPLLGLLGTVIGMIDAFMRIQEAGTVVDPAVLSGGIWEALLTTAFGLTIAIPAMAAFYLFEGEIDRVRSAMADVSTRVLTRFGKLTVPPRTLVTEDVAREDYAV